MMTLFKFVFLASVVISATAIVSKTIFNIGIGKADITGPASEVTMMGYADFKQKTAGIHTRQFSRCYIIGDNKSRVVFISIEACMTSQAVYMKVIKKLKAKYGDLYTEKNVCISSIHTHSTPGGFFQYTLYNIPSNGFVRDTYNSLVKGILKSIEIAHNNMRPGYILWNKGDLYNASINRSPTSYLNNPAEEIAQYDSNVDTEMVLLKFIDINGNSLGMVNWFPVHATSINKTNTVVSSDNKGYASLTFEKIMNTSVQEEKLPFVAAFAQANEGDVSPNTRGPTCIDTGLPCDLNTSTCNGENSKCIASGPGKDMFDSTRIIGTKQYEKAMELFQNASSWIAGPVSFIQQYIDMSNMTVKIDNSTYVTTCKPALGNSFMAGTTDGPGSSDFMQGGTSTNFIWSLLRRMLANPSEAIKNCQKPKPVFIPTGEMNFPSLWQPTIVPVQILRVGQLAIVAVPAEFTTMAGRRLRNAVKKILDGCSSTDNIVVIAGLSNAYSSYVTTFEEYQVQRYEGASTLYGPHTLQAYIQKFKELAKSLCTGGKLPDGPAPPDLVKYQTFLPSSVQLDIPYPGKEFGDVIEDVQPTYCPGMTVCATYVAGNPRNDPMLDRTFLAVERCDNKTEECMTIARDSDWETRYEWKTEEKRYGEAKVCWKIPEDSSPGTYRIRHFGYYKTSAFSRPDYYSGISSIFEISECDVE